MPYGQQFYPQHLGNSQAVTISEEGCLLTAIANGLQRFNGAGPDPVTLNQFFVSHGVYSYDAIDRAADDLAWDSISKFDPTIQLQQVGQGSVPPSNNAIVKFHYNSVHTGFPVDHYCWVDHVDGSEVYIIDSWDGLVKGPTGYQNVYHVPIAWGTYVKTTPQPIPTPPVAVTPVPIPVQLPNGAQTADSPLYKPVVVPLHGYSNATAAANHDEKAQGQDIQPGTHYFLFTSKYGMDNITTVSGEPGSWINPADNVMPKIVIEPIPIPEPEPLPPPEDDGVNKWKASYVSLRKDRKMVKYVMLHDVLISDLSGKGPHDKPMHLRKYQEIGIYGTFKKGGVTYWRPRLAKDVHFDYWYGIEMMTPDGEPVMEEQQLLYNTETTVAERKALKTTKPGDLPIVAIGTLERYLEDGVKFIDGIFAKHKKTKK